VKIKWKIFFQILKKGFFKAVNFPQKTFFRKL